MAQRGSGTLRWGEFSNTANSCLSALIDHAKRLLARTKWCKFEGEGDLRERGEGGKGEGSKRHWPS